MWLEFPRLLSQLSHNPSCRAIILSGAGDRAFTTGLDVTAAVSSNLFNPTSSIANGPEPWETSNPSSNLISNHSQENNNTAYPRPHPPPFQVSSQPHQTPDPPDPARIAHHLRTRIQTFQSSITSLAQCRKPLIAALHGHCLGLGIDIACCADIRFCTPDTKFSVKEVDIGLAADVGTLTRLGKIVGNEGWCKEVCLSARGWGAEEAKEVGFVSRVVSGSPTSPSPTAPRKNSQSPSRRSVSGSGSAGDDPSKSALLAAAISLAELIASKSPVAVEGTKDIMDFSREHTTEDGLRYTAVWNMSMLQTGDIKEAMIKGMRKERGRFAKL